jgi:multiple sugar transport system substrate-binding protein
VAIPIQPMPELLFVRSDLFERERLALPARTGEVLEAARRLTDPVAGRHGIAWCGRQGTPVGQSFLQIMASFGNPVIDLRRSGGGYDLDVSGERMRPRLDRPEALATLEYMRELLEHSHPGVLDMSWPEVIEAFSGGKVAMAYAWSCRSGTFELDPSSPAHGRVAYLPHPSGPTGRSISPIGGAALGIPANLPKDRIAAAFRTMQWLTSPEMMKWYALRGTLVSARFSVSADPEVTEGRSVIKVVDGLAREGKLNLWPRPPIPELARITDILGLEVHACLRKERSPAQALQRSQSLVDALMRRQHHY